LEEIFSLRKRIDEVDEEILLLLKERVDIARKIGVLKRRVGLPVRDSEREEEVYEKVMEKAAELGLNPQDIEDIYKKIVAMCINIQKEK